MVRHSDSLSYSIDNWWNYKGILEMMKEEIKIKLNILTEDSLPEDITAKQINTMIKIIE